ncbi:hypothetical protein ACIQXF_05530 [Lysinibacillus sp. NPDC097231]|uniref:hypothetical protein n=1 Tax=Lysinibacillus sp. NPDC097231 TaxID=3364142 RepID=UPI00380C39B7
MTDIVSALVLLLLSLRFRTDKTVLLSLRFRTDKTVLLSLRFRTDKTVLLSLRFRAKNICRHEHKADSGRNYAHA